ncbi:MAG: transglutaminase family protein [Aphanocapsa feldmannii 277cV]|uniref:Transglutaminase family protein n=1 Tax=Aphanocapsa feldmannii 277cV TaxID=2507553 RepID=A0A524RNS5_9CHRO|nr:MAG: transglutaminase family protein [Aphanocapsa feldmannii 277cV]
MKVNLTHRLSYDYTSPVQLGEHRLCLRPRSHGYQRLLHHHLEVHPGPQRSLPMLAAGNDEVLKLWFAGQTEHFMLEAVSTVVTQLPPPLDLCIDGEVAPLPYRPGDLDAELHANLRGWLANGQHDPAVVELAQESLLGSEGQCLLFFDMLHRQIQERVNYTERHHGTAWPAGRTLRERLGSCRDLAVLMIEACRCVGLPARFTSGYHLADDRRGAYDLHAWCEVYVPGAGWRGFDPSCGCPVDDRYVVLAASADPTLTAAVQGSFSGAPGVTSHMVWSIEADITAEGDSSRMAGLCTDRDGCSDELQEASSAI